MCRRDVADIECCESDCEEFVSYKTVISEWRCDAVNDNAGADWCPNLKVGQLPAQKSPRVLCRACRGRPVAEQNELYGNLNLYIAESMEEQRRLDDARRASARTRGPRPGSAGNHSTGTAAAAAPEEQAALVSGAGMEWQGGRTRGAAPPGAGGRPGFGGSGFPRELEFGADETAGQGGLA